MNHVAVFVTEGSVGALLARTDVIMHIRVHTLTGVTTSFELSSTDASLSSLKAVLAEQWSVPVAGQILVLAGKIMSPDSARLDKFLTGGDNIIHNIVVFFSHRRHQSVFHEQLLKVVIPLAVDLAKVSTR